MNIFKVYLFLILAGSLCACEGFTPISAGDGSSMALGIKPAYGTCDRKDISVFNICSEVNGADYNDTDYLNILKSNCEATGGSFSTANCDRARSIGTCIVGAQKSNEVYTLYYPPLYTPSSAQADCANHGGLFF